MPFKTNSTGRKLYNKLRVSDSVILARSVTYPNAIDDSEIIGDDRTVKFLAINEDLFPSSPTDYDPDFFFVSSSEGPESGWKSLAHPSYFISHVITKRPTSEIKQKARDKETLIRNVLASPQQTTADLYILVAALFDNQQDLSLTTKQQEALDNANKLAFVFLENKTKLDEKLASIEQGQEPDLSSGFLTSLP